MWAYPTVTDMSSENATRVSTSAGTAILLNFAQKSKNVLMWDFIFFAVPGAYKYFWVSIAADRRAWKWSPAGSERINNLNYQSAEKRNMSSSTETSCLVGMPWVLKKCFVLSASVHLLIKSATKFSFVPIFRTDKEKLNRHCQNKSSLKQACSFTSVGFW